MNKTVLQFAALCVLIFQALLFILYFSSSTTGWEHIKRDFRNTIGLLNKFPVFGSSLVWNISDTEYMEESRIDKPLCTHSVLKNYFYQFGRFPNVGSWKGSGCVTKLIPKPNGDASYYKPMLHRSRLLNDSYPCPEDKVRNLTFHPDICRFAHDGKLPKMYFSTCFRRLNISKLVTFGDSNGRRYHDTIVNLMNATSGISCTTIRTEKSGDKAYQMDLNYFKLGGLKAKVTLERRGCHSCGSILQECVIEPNTASAPKKILLEHIPLQHFRDASVKLVDYISDISNRTVYYPEFIFRYYLVHDPPDTVVIQAPFNHEKYHKSLYRATKDMKYFFDVLDKYLPNSTSVYIVPAFHEQEQLKDLKVYPPRGFKYGGFTANELIDRMNVALYHLLDTKFLDESRKYYGYFDLGEISVDVSLEWACDAMHMFYLWYEKTMVQFLQLFCEAGIS